ncbi:unnamed protein product [Oppiella nova]|uniref:Uncharacterized protein n=1 Tax=Oppiella nova TaxID=334625 RepID=A0A7R9MT57_9ACAR|nr:unnamed protein product [Oppiella nova]CAG2182839.1 unnamed protein product [Oppiella nova]
MMDENMRLRKLKNKVMTIYRNSAEYSSTQITCIWSTTGRTRLFYGAFLRDNPFCNSPPLLIVSEVNTYNSFYEEFPTQSQLL